MKRTLLVLLPVLITLFGLSDSYGQPVTGTGPDTKMMWKQLTVEAYQIAEALRSGALGTDARDAMRQVAQDRPVLFWVVIDWSNGYPPEDPLAEMAIADLFAALQDLYDKSEAASASSPPTSP